MGLWCVHRKSLIGSESKTNESQNMCYFGVVKTLKQINPVTIIKSKQGMFKHNLVGCDRFVSTSWGNK